MRPLDHKTYEVFLQLIKGIYNKPVKDRSQLEKNAIILFWRRKQGLSLRLVHGREVLFHDGKEVLTQSQFPKKVNRKIKVTKGGGARSIAYSLKEKYSGISEQKVLKVLEKSRKHGETHAEFSNRAPFKTILASNVFERVQIDLLRMKDVSYENKTFRYILVGVDVFSRYVFLRPLENKSTVHVALAIKSIFQEHGYPRTVQTDNGPEFLGDVQRLLKKNNVRILKSRPYHPQTQGKVERQNRIIRSKVRYEMARKRRQGFNWVECLSGIASAINKQPKEVLGYQTPFSVYYGRPGNPNDVREKAEQSSIKCAKRFLSRQLKKHSCSIYRRGDKVLVKYPLAKSRVPYKVHVLRGKVVKRGKGFDKYLVMYEGPDKKTREQWINVENITSTTKDEEKRRRAHSIESFLQMEKRRIHKAKYYIPLENNSEILEVAERIEAEESNEDPQISDSSAEETFFSNPRIKLLKDPRGFGDCQFVAVSDQLKDIGLYQSSAFLRSIAVDHLIQNREHYEDYVEGDFDTYIQQMKKESTYGDNLTLIALARELNCQFFVVNSQGHGYHRFVSNTNRFERDLQLFTLGYYPEQRGEHYVSIRIESEYLQTLINEASEDPEQERHIQFEDAPVSVETNIAENESPLSNETLEQSRNEHRGEQRSNPSGQQPEEQIYHFGSSLETGARSSPENADALSGVNKSRNDQSEDQSSDALRQETIQQIQSECSATTTLDRSIEESRNDKTVEQRRERNRPDVNCNSLNADDTSCPANQEIPFLPDLVLRKIIQISVRENPIMRYTLQRVCRLFADVVESTEYPSIYINPLTMPCVPRRVSVARLSRTFGSHSGLMLKLRAVLRETGSRWFRAWLTLYERENSWYEIRDITWR